MNGRFNRYSPRPSPVRGSRTTVNSGGELTDGATTRYGIHPVMEALAAGVAQKVVATGTDRPQVAAVLRRALYLRVPVHEVAAGELDRLTSGGRHQGVAAIVRPYRFLTFDQLRVRIAAAQAPPLLIALDGIEDPQNFGAVLRTAEGSGALAVVVGSKNSAPVTAAVARASAGAVDRVPVVQVTSLPSSLQALKRDGFRVIGLDGGSALAYDSTDLQGRVVLVAGSEGRGLGRTVLQSCDSLVAIPLHGAVASLNVSVAVAVVAFEVWSQRRSTNDVTGAVTTAATEDSRSAMADNLETHAQGAPTLGAD